ncbi:MAG: hypothetical protein KDI56_12205 [Xanthomonadales bacterium]|nr:hypothetical protein [Xanthomonadales bacterium]
MSLCDVRLATLRISRASPESPIAMFRVRQDDFHRAGRVDCVFASTVQTQTRIGAGDPRYLGTFCSESDPGEVSAAFVRGLQEQVEA